MDYNIKRLAVGQLGTNCYIIKDKNSRDAAVIDPGGDGLLIKKALFDMGATVKAVLLTHGHFDHVLALDDIRGKSTVAGIHTADAELLLRRDAFTSMLEFDPRPLKPADILFEKEGHYRIDPFDFYVMHTPGHTPGSVCFIFGDIMFTGDTLFKNSIGTTVFGDDDAVLDKTLEALCRYPVDYAVYPGHDELTSLSDEKKYNPYLRKFRK